jgi:hypothetical protein
MRLRVRLLFALPLALAAAAGWPQQPGGSPRSLVVTVRDDPPAPIESAPATTETNPRVGSVTLSTGRPLSPGSYGNAQVLSTQPGERSATILEGEPFRISMPAPQSLWVGIHGRGASPKGAAPAAAAGGQASVRTDATGVVHFDAISDFTARIRLAGTTVAVELQPLAPGRIDGGADLKSGHATVYGRIGQWIELGESGTDLRSPAPGGSDAPRAGLWIKVESAVAGH